MNKKDHFSATFQVTSAENGKGVTFKRVGDNISACVLHKA